MGESDQISRIKRNYVVMNRNKSFLEVCFSVIPINTDKSFWHCLLAVRVKRILNGYNWLSIDGTKSCNALILRLWRFEFS